jgi:hypothetical protein
MLNIILFLSSCFSQSTNEKIKNTRGDTTLSKRLEGIWAKNEKDNALFFIKDDSLYYIEDQNHPVSLTIKGDTLIINGDLPAKCKILKLTKDSLWFKDEFNPNITKLFRRQ